MLRRRSRRLVVVDVVPGVMHVETRIECLEWLPIRVLPSELVVHPGEREERRYAAKLSTWAVCLFVLRSVFFTTAVVSLLGMVASAFVGSPASPIWPMALAFAIPAFLLAMLISSMNRATYEHAHQLAEGANLPAEVRLEIDVAFGLLSTEQAVTELKRRERKELACRDGIESRIVHLFASTW
jgi:hypothetical protein